MSFLLIFVKLLLKFFNVGDNENNFTKQMIVKEILEYFPHGKVKYLDKGVDKETIL